MPLWSYATFSQNFDAYHNTLGPNWMGITWSLAVEEQFYFVCLLLSATWILGSSLVARRLYPGRTVTARSIITRLPAD